MAKLPDAPDPTLVAVDQAIVKANTASNRTYLGASELGHACSRRLWMKWRWVSVEHFDAVTLRRFHDGFAGEDLMAERLKAVDGIRLVVEDPDERQWAVTAVGEHVQGHLDGAILGIHQAPKTWHVWEHKQVSEKNWRALKRKKDDFGEKSALEAWNETYFVQAQLYMGLTGMKRHYMTITTPGGRDITSVRTDFQAKAFDRAIEKAEEIVAAQTAPPRISEDPEFFLCKWCHLNKNCHGDTTAAVNCRTCAHSTPVTGGDKGVWWCELHDKKLTLKEQRKGCTKHLFIPELIPWAHVHLKDQLNNQIHYRTDAGNEFVNAEHNAWEKTPKHFASKDLQHITAYNIDNDDVFFQHMAKFSPSITKVVKGKGKKEELPFNDPWPT